MDPPMDIQEADATANSTLSQFDAELLSVSIANNDNIIRSYHEKCDEIEHLRADIQSITGSANQVRQMFENEKLQKDRLHKENMEMQMKLDQLNGRLIAINNEQVNSETLYNQTVAEFEAKTQKEKQKYLDLCRIVVDQGNILQSNSLSMAHLTRKCTFARETLESHGIKCEKVKSPKKKQDPNRIKSKTMCTMTDPMPDPSPILLPKPSTPVKTCNQSTQYQQSKATRSTCTSTFISFADAFTTMADQESQDYFNPMPDVNVMREEVDSYPMLLSPIPEQIISKMAQSTQTHEKEYCTRETLTTINNVRKPIDYVRVDSPVGGVWPEKVKKEDISSALGSMSNLCWTCLANHRDLSRDAGSQLNPSLSHLWQLMGHVIFTMIDQRNNFEPGNQTTTHQNSMQRMQHQLQNMIDEHVKGTEDVPDVTMNGASNDAMDLDEHSRDSIESYNSGKIVISKVRDSSEVLSESQAESMDGSKTDGAIINIDDRRTRKVTESMPESNRNLGESLKAQSPHRITVRNVASGSETIPEERVNNRSISSRISAIPKIVVTSNEILPQKEISGHSNSVVNDFKIPKRKSSDDAAKSNTKKRKSANVGSESIIKYEWVCDSFFSFQSATSEKELMTSIFGDDLKNEPSRDIIDEDEQIRNIFNFFKMPSKIVSPIKDPENLMPVLTKEPTVCMSLIKDLDSELVNPECSTKWPRNLMTDLHVEPIEPIDQELVHPESYETKKPEDSIVSPMADLNEEPIVDPVTDLAEKPMTDSIEKITVDINKTAIEEPAKVLIEEPAFNENVNPAGDSVEQPNDINSPTAQESTDITMGQNDASYDKLSLSPVSSNGTITSSPKVDEFTKCNNEPEINYYSPASPPPECNTETEPCVIPTETLHSNQTSEESNKIQHDSFESEINQIIQDYSPKFARTVAMSSISTLSNQDSYLMASLRNAIERYCMSKEWTSETVTKCLNRMLSVTRHVKYLAIALLETVEDTQEMPSLEFTPPAPAMPPSIQRCILLYTRLTHNLPTFSEYFKIMLERKMFVFKNELPVEALINLTHFYIAINDIEQSLNPANMRLFIYKCLYYFTYKCIPLVFTVLMAHPFILPHANSVEFLTDPLNKAIVTVLTNLIYSVDNKDKSYKKTEMFLTLKNRFGYFADKVFAIDGIIEYCIDCIQNNRLTNIEYALILLAKHQGYEYAIKNIIQKYLIPLLHRYFTDDLTTNTEYDQQITTILFVISSIVKTVPTDECIDDYVNLLAVALNATDRQIIQEAAISGMCQLSRFGTTRIYQLISTWKPNYIKSKRITAILSTIVYKKPMNFWFNSNRNIEVEHNDF